MRKKSTSAAVNYSSLLVLFSCIGLAHDMLLYYRAAADNDVTVIHDDRLTFGDGALRLIEDDGKRISVRLGDGCPLLLLMIADACFYAARLGDSVAVDEVDVFSSNIFGE